MSTGTKIMATMGPSIHDVDILCQMLEAGMVSGRVDLTWGPLEFHRNSLGLLQARTVYGDGSESELQCMMMIHA